jgi:hypothetical protein
MEFDVVEGSATLNGKPVGLTMASILHDWVLAELGRKQLPASWLLSARVSVQYSGIARDKSGELADLTATATISTSYGNFSASLGNAQLIFHHQSGIGP